MSPELCPKSFGTLEKQAPGQNSAVRRCGLILKILDAQLIMDFSQKMKFFLENECSDYRIKCNQSKQSGEHHRVHLQSAGFQDDNFARKKLLAYIM